MMAPVEKQVYQTKKKDLYEIWQEVKQFLKDVKLPGMVNNARFPIISVDVPRHVHRHPHLIVDEELLSKDKS